MRIRREDSPKCKGNIYLPLNLITYTPHVNGSNSCPGFLIGSLTSRRKEVVWVKRVDRVGYKQPMIYMFRMNLRLFSTTAAL